MAEIFSIQHPSGETQKGLFWKADNSVGSVVIATGMQEPSSRYGGFAEFLNKNQISAYCLDSFGQGLNVDDLTDRQKWPVDAFKKNVDGLSMVLELAKKNNGGFAILFGHSMGSFMVQSFLETYPGKADKYVICGSNGPAKLLMALGDTVAKVLVNKKNWDLPSPFLTNLAMGGYSKAIKGRKTDLDWLSYNEENVKKYIDDPLCGFPNTCGFWKGFLDGMNTLYRKKYLKNISKSEKILIVSGDGDPVGNMAKGPIALEKMYRKLGVKDVTLIIYEKMRHEILQEKEKDKVYLDILNFINK